MNNRRNLYRILHVQPEAPLEIIKASYRNLMMKLRNHPDLGGNHETAALINKAYAILSDPQKRRQYDEMLRLNKNRGQTKNTQVNDKHSPTQCLFCKATLPAIQTKSCPQCTSPLLMAKPIPNQRLGELFGRRTTPRITKSGTLIIYPNWPHAGYPARLHDLSPTGISFHTEYGARSGQLLKIDSINLKGIARIVSVRSKGAHFSVHAAFMTVEFMVKAGVFVTETA